MFVQRVENIYKMLSHALSSSGSGSVEPGYTSYYENEIIEF